MTTWMDQLARLGAERPGDATRAAMALRRECELRGHRYQITGSTNPTKLECRRCEVTWAIGARTEPGLSGPRMHGDGG